MSAMVQKSGDPQRIAVIGSGAVGCFYGALLQRAGHDVHFLMRRELEAARRDGLHITSPDGDFHLPDVQAYASSDEIGPADWALCALKTTSLGAARDLIAPCVGEQTRVIAMMNGLGVEDCFAEWFGGERVYGVLAFVCVNRGEPGHIHHKAYGRLTVGHFLDSRADVERLVGLLATTGVECLPRESLLMARWEKLIWNVAYNGFSVAAGGVSTRMLMDDELVRQQIRAVMEEVVSAGNADLSAHGEAARLNGPELIEWMLGTTDHMDHYATSMCNDYLSGNELEWDAILAEPVRRARRLSVPVPHMEQLLALVRLRDRVRRGVVATPESFRMK